MKVTKEEILEIAQANGLNAEEAEKFLLLVGKGIGGSLIDLIKLVAEKSENKIDDMIVLAGEKTLRDLVNDLDIVL